MTSSSTACDTFWRLAPRRCAARETTIKQVSRRVKDTDKFWNKQGLEALLQVRAAYLSEDVWAEAHSAKRPLGQAAGRGLLRRRAAA